MALIYSQVQSMWSGVFWLMFVSLRLFVFWWGICNLLYLENSSWGSHLRRVLEALNPLKIKKLTFLFYFGSLLENTYVIKNTVVCLSNFYFMFTLMASHALRKNSILLQTICSTLQDLTPASLFNQSHLFSLSHLNSVL